MCMSHRRTLCSSTDCVAPPSKPCEQHDRNTDLEIDFIEFYQAVRQKLRYQGPTWVVQQTFDLIDTDRDGKLGFDEMVRPINSLVSASFCVSHSVHGVWTQGLKHL